MLKEMPDLVRGRCILSDGRRTGTKSKIGYFLRRWVYEV